MSIDKKTVEYVAHLSRIDLDSKELDKISGQLSSIFNFIDKLQKADITNVQPTSHILPISNVLRKDEASESIPVNIVLENAPKSEGNFYVVPKVIE